MNLRPWTLPNFLTLTRLAALPFLIVSILQGRHGTALVIFLVASITDIVDGYLARRFAMGSPLGAYLDPIADKLFLVSTFVVFTIPSTPSKIHIPVWLLVITIFRDVFILVIALLTVATSATPAQSFGFGIAVIAFLVGILGVMFLAMCLDNAMVRSN